MASLVKKPKMDMTKGNMVKQIVLFAIPIIATTYMQLFFNTADTIMVGWFGGEDEAARNAAIGAVSSCSALIHLIISIFNGLSVGTGVSVSHEIGAKKYENIEKIIHTSVTVGLICGLTVSLVGVFFADVFLSAMSTPADILPGAAAYMRAYFIGTPAQLIYSYCAAALRAEGDTTHPFTFITAAGVVNVLLNALTVCAFGMGALGVGIATAASQWVSCIMILVYMMRSSGVCKISLSKLRIHWKELKKLLSIGLPAGVQSAMFSLANVFIQSSVNSFDDPSVVTGNGIGSNVGQYINQTGSSISQATLTIVGQNVGAKNHARVKRGVIVSALMVFAVNLTLSTAVNLFSGPILSLFAPGTGEEISRSISVGQIRLLVVGMTYCLAGIDQVAANTLQAFGRSTTVMTVALAGACGFRLLWIFTVFQFFHEIWVLYLAFPISWVLLSVTQFIICASEIKKFKSKCATEENLNEIPV
jgi:putative MATE family efflux protein